jgi:hypothetical protein
MPEDYISGPHEYWPHFLVGLVFGTLLGWWFFDDLASNAAINFLLICATALGLALFCGRWGEPGWRRISDWLAWWFGTLR